AESRWIARFVGNQGGRALHGRQLAKPGYAGKQVRATGSAAEVAGMMGDCGLEIGLILALPYDTVLSDTELGPPNHLRQFDDGDGLPVVIEFIEYAVGNVAPEVLCGALGNCDEDAVGVGTSFKGKAHDRRPSNDGARPVLAKALACTCDFLRVLLELVN